MVYEYRFFEISASKNISFGTETDKENYVFRMSITSNRLRKITKKLQRNR